MKKIIILILFIFTLSGCYDYKEINNLAIVSAIGIDYKDDEYIVTLEILNDQIDKNSYKITSYTKTATGKNITKAIEKAADKISNQANYTHVKLLLLSENKTKTLRLFLKIKPDRVHTMFCGLLILDAITSYFSIQNIQICTNGVREGYLIQKYIGGKNENNTK